MIDKYDFYADTDNKNKDAFNDALPIGNGKIGAMVYGNPRDEKLILNDETLWLGKKGKKRYNKDSFKYLCEIKEHMKKNEISEAEKLVSEGLFSAPKGCSIYSVAAEVRIKTDNLEYNNYERQIDYENGIVTYETENLSREFFASYKKNAIIIHMKNETPLTSTITLDREKLYDSIKKSKHRIRLKYSYSPKDKLYIYMGARSDGKVTYTSNHIVIKNYKEATIIITIDTTYRHKDAKIVAYTNNKKALKTKYDILLNEHRDDFSSLFNRTYMNLSDSNMEKMYNMSKYLVISSSRGGSFPANLQGLWCQDIFPKWDSKYTININTQMNMWPILSYGLKESYWPIFKLLNNMYENAKKTAKVIYHAKGAVAFHNTDIYGDCAPQDYYMPATYWPFGFAWLSLSVLEYYKFTKNKGFLKAHKNLILDSMKFFDSILEENEQGYLVVTPSLSPENSYLINGEKHHLAEGCSMDSSILFDLYSAVIYISKEFKNKKLEAHAAEVLKKLPPLRLSQYDTIAEWNKDYEEAEPGHRHISQLYALYPSFRMPEELKDKAYNTIKRRLENGGGHTGWSKVWIMCMFARLNDSNNFYKNFNEFILNSTSRVGLDLHPPFQIDGNFGCGAALNEMIYRFDGYNLTLLPAVPVSINGSIKVYLTERLQLFINFDGKVVKELKLIGNGKININTGFTTKEVVVEGEYVEENIIIKDYDAYGDFLDDEDKLDMNGEGIVTKIDSKPCDESLDIQYINPQIVKEDIDDTNDNESLIEEKALEEDISNDEFFESGKQEEARALDETIEDKSFETEEPKEDIALEQANVGQAAFLPEEENLDDDTFVFKPAKKKDNESIKVNEED